MTRAVNFIRNVSPLFTLTLVLAGVRVACGQDEPAAYMDKDAYDVYSVLLARELQSDNLKAKLVIEIESTDYPQFGGSQSDCLIPAEGEKAMYDPVVAAYREANKRKWLLQPKFAASIPYQLVSASSVKEIFAKKGVDGWKDFYKKYPNSGGVTSLSAVGFSSDKTIAIVYMGNSCGGLCGGGTYHLLKKTKGVWTKIDWHGAICTWAS